MKITVITCPFGALPPNAIGAVEKLLYLIADVWVQHHHEVCFICAGGGDNNYIKHVRLKKYSRTGTTKKDIFWDLLYSIKALWKCPKTDILLCNTFWTPVLAPLFRWKYKRLVYEVQRVPKGQYFLYPFVHSFICVSIAVADELKRQLSEGRNLFTINNPIDINVFDPNKTDNENSRTVVYAGRVHPEKGLDILFEAMQILVERKGHRGLKLKIIGATDIQSGGGGEDYVNQLVCRATDVEVEWVEAISDPIRLASEIGRGICFVYPSVAEKGETFGVAPLEAMALGMPVVLSDLKCFADFAEPGLNSLRFTRGENAVNELVEALEEIINSPSRRKYLAENAAKTAKNFSAEKIAVKYEDAFNEMLLGKCGLSPVAQDQ